MLVQDLLTVAWEHMYLMKLMGRDKPGPVPQLFGHTACATKQTCLERAELGRTRLISAG